ncbi:MAG TPA: LysR family transcriptional regulator [Stellaceae bacterium]|nr:LysR family transcriptional regulator [Stellaceae bacterium]
MKPNDHPMSHYLSLHQVRAVIAVFEEGSFTRAAEREHATQSGISQHVSSLEKALGLRLFERLNGGIKPTAAGETYYRYALEAMATLETAKRETLAIGGRVHGELNVGLMPTFTRAALTPVLEDYIRLYPDVQLRVNESYSWDLTAKVLDGLLDFAIVPHFEGRTGLNARRIARDREMLISGKRSGLVNLQPARLAGHRPLKLVLPSRQNTRRRTIDGYLLANGIAVDSLLEMDAMIGTLEFVASTDWMTVLPALICRNDADGQRFIINPLADPPLHVDFVLIEPARTPLSLQARLFVERLEHQVAVIEQDWRRLLGEA